MMNIEYRLRTTSFVGILLFALLYGQQVLAHSEGHGKEVPAHDPMRTEFGDYDPAMKPERTIQIIMTDSMRFVPDTIYLLKGEVVKLMFSNSGKMVHEFVMGSALELERHASLMESHPNMEHEEPHVIHLDPGVTGSLTWRFSHSGTFTFACLIPGHWDAGMRGEIVVRS